MMQGMQGMMINSGNTDPGSLYRQMSNTIVDNNFTNYIKQNAASVLNTISNRGGAFVNNIKHMYNVVNDNSAVARAKDLLTLNANVIVDDRITNITKSNIFNAGMLNKRYIMANPDIFDMYTNNRCNGYDDIWLNTDVVTDPYDRSDYLRAMDGVYQFEKDGARIIRVYEEEEEKLTVTEKFVISDMWDVAMGLVKEGIDPTDENKGKL